MADYKIFTDAAADLSPELVTGLPPIEVFPLQVEIGGVEYAYGTPDGITASAFYRVQREDSFASATQINPSVYFRHFEPWLRQGVDILYLCFSSGLSGAYQSAQMAVEELRMEYPDRKIFCIDTLGASAGEGFLVREAARKQAEGLSLTELLSWIAAHRMKVCHWFTVDTFAHLKHGGRVSSAAAFMGTALQIKPLLHVDAQGKLQPVEKPRGRKRAIAAQIAHMEQGWLPELGKSVLIAHADDPDGAAMLKAGIEERFSAAEVQITDIGPIIGAHTGPGALALFYWGSNR